jgi:RNA polymerase sigma-70 factor (family 1)
MKYQYLSETALLQLTATDDPAAYEVLYNRYWQPLFLFAYKRLKNTDASKDAVQDVFINLWRRRATLQLTASLRTYLFTAVRYEVLNKIAQSQKVSGSDEIAFLPIPVEAETIGILNEKELQQALIVAVDNLPRKMKEIYQLGRQQHKSIPEIAEELCLSEQTVKNQLSNALTRLRRHLKEASVILSALPGIILFLNN